jgi:hypothetical protein
MSMAKDAVLLHVGPHKTGTTAMQASLFAARKRMAKHGVYLANAKERHPRTAILEGTGGRAIRGALTSTLTTWADLQQAVSSHPADRVVISSELFSNTKQQRIPGLVDDLGGPRVQVVLTVRSLARVLPSQWQQYLTARLTLSYEAWLEEVFNNPEGTVARRFWRRHAYDRAVDRWRSAVGADRLWVVAVDPAKPDQLLRGFETLLGLPDGLLRPPKQSNPSLSLGEAELLRLINIAAKRSGWSDDDYARTVRRTLAERMKNRPPAPEDQPITTPAWAVDAAADRQRDAIAHIESSGVRVVGDLRALLGGQDASDRRAIADPQDPLLAACDMLDGLFRRDAPGAGVEAVPTRRLLQITRDRVLRSMFRRR